MPRIHMAYYKYIPAITAFVLITHDTPINT